ncbi:4-phosphopantoate--beta-alanine ligase [Natronosalvus amylolyticus]|uniref:4-phosphopantoate--beta-alanine ligase n=1 Tax=Natronosalvus amylolyticus TaxID=2961994 RepID=UPI0020C99412|nr:4-phosphopantoate--beta-alanine ligase [Natronosalvus amylolyticus]
MSDHETVPAAVEHEDEIPLDHPRYTDLVTRHRIERGVEKGITHLQGMHAEGRGSAFDYLLGEETTETADEAERAAAAHLLSADQPVLSINGNVAALVPGEMVELAAEVDADLEINLFNRTPERIGAIESHLREHGATAVKGLEADARIPNLDHERSKVDAEGIYSADVVLVPLEDGDRAEALEAMGKTEIVIDLNPLSRSPQVADVPVVDNIVRAIPNMTAHARALQDASEAELEGIIDAFDRERALEAAESRIRNGL